MTGPLHKHDCTTPGCCIFLGTVRGLEANPAGVDIYRHNCGDRKEGKHGLLARYGDDGPDYLSSLKDVHPFNKFVDKEGRQAYFAPAIVAQALDRWESES